MSRQNEKLNNFGIDEDSKVHVTVVEAIGLEMGCYYVSIACGGTTLSTTKKNYEGKLIWNEPFEM